MIARCWPGKVRATAPSEIEVVSPWDDDIDVYIGPDG
jgi:hypothetical protein